jgi:hypothetical protein
VIGELTDADGGYFTVEGPTGELAMRLAMDSDVEGSNVIGEPIEVGGRRLNDGSPEATRVRPGCGVAVAAETTVPSSETGTPTPPPASSAAPTPFRTPVLVPFEPVNEPVEPEPTQEPVTEAPTPEPVTEAPTAAPTPGPTEEPRPTRTTEPEPAPESS